MKVYSIIIGIVILSIGIAGIIKSDKLIGTIWIALGIIIIMVGLNG